MQTWQDNNNFENSIKNFYEQNPYPDMELQGITDGFKKQHAGYKMHNKIMMYILSSAGLSTKWLSGKRILDAGCGTGEKALYCANLGAQVTGIDISRNSIERANKKAQEKKYSIDFINMNIMDVNWKNKFDLVLTIGVLHHIRDHQRAFLVLANATKTNGYLIVGFYNLFGRLRTWLEKYAILIYHGGYRNTLQYFSKKYGNDSYLYRTAIDKYLNPYEKAFTYQEMETLFEKNGFEVIKTLPEIKTPIIDEALMLAKNKFFMIMAGKKKIDTFQEDDAN